MTAPAQPAMADAVEVPHRWPDGSALADVVREPAVWSFRYTCPGGYSLHMMLRKEGGNGQLTAMVHMGADTWECQVRLPPGRYTVKFYERRPDGVLLYAGPMATLDRGLSQQVLIPTGTGRSELANPGQKRPEGGGHTDRPYNPESRHVQTAMPALPSA